MLQNISISSRLLTAFLVIVACVLLIGFIGYRNIVTIGDVNLPSIESLATIQTAMDEAVIAERGFVIGEIVGDKTKRTSLFEQIQHSIYLIDSARSVYEPLPMAPGENELWQAFVSHYQEWMCENDTLLSFAKSLDAKLNNGITSTDPDYIELQNAITGQVLDSRTDWLAAQDKLDAVIRLNSTNAAASVRSSEKQILFISLLAFILGIGLATVIARSITTPINQTSAMLCDIAQGEGDLTRRLPVVGKDEISELCRWFNTFVQKIQGVVKSIDSNTITLSAASEELSAASTQIAASAEESSAQAGTVASASEQATTNIQNISKSAEQMSTSMNTVASAIEEMNSSLQHVVKNCEEELSVALKASEQATDARKHMETLGAVAKEVDKIVEVITGIAAQTNLLALNATIEAASAGEAGKGFAVVAGEVKDLARQTSQATHSIGDQIKRMQDSTKVAVTSISGIVDVIQQIRDISQSIVHAVNEQSQTISEIARSVSLVNNGSQHITSNVAESGKGLAEIARNIAGVNDSTRNTSAGLHQINQSAGELAKLSATLEGIVKQFKI